MRVETDKREREIVEIFAIGKGTRVPWLAGTPRDQNKTTYSVPLFSLFFENCFWLKSSHILSN